MKVKKIKRLYGEARKFVFAVCCPILAASFLISACASTPELPPPPPKYVHEEEKAIQPTTNSLWRDTASLFEDTRARRLNDLVTIKVSEKIEGSGKADTNTSRESSMEAGVDNIFGVTPNITGVEFFGDSKVFSPSISASSASEFDGSGETTREGKLTGTITAKVVEVMPNGNLVLESRKDIIINNEKQILILRGMARPDDVDVDNTISSDKVADAEVYFVGDGILMEKQSSGWFGRFLDTVWPF